MTTTTTIESLQQMGFAPAPSEVPKRLIASVSGLDKTGKTHFAFTAPDPILYFSIDIGDEGVVEKFVQKGKQILKTEVKFSKEGNMVDVKNSCMEVWQDFKAKLYAAFQLGEGTVVVDTATEAYELCRLAHFGKLTQVMPQNYIEVNTEWREFLRTAYDSTMSAVFIHKLKKQWEGSSWNGQYEVAGFGEMGYMVQMNLRTDWGKTLPAQPTITVENCRQKPQLNGVPFSGDAANFNVVLNAVHG